METVGLWWIGASLLIPAVLVMCLPSVGFAVQSTYLSPHSKTIFREGAADLKKGDFQAAVSALEEFLKLDGQFGPAYLNLGLAYHSLKQYERAIPAFTRALELDKQSESAALFLGIDYCKLDVPEKAVNPLEIAVALRPQDPDAHLWLGRALLAGGRYEQAIPHLERASKAYPQDSALLYDLSQAYLHRSQQICDKIYRNNPHSYWAYFLLGQAYSVEGKVDLAIIEFKHAIGLNPSLPGVHAALGELYLKKRDFDDAEKEFMKELGINAYNYQIVCKLADVQIQTGNVQEAIPLLNKTVAMRPSLGCAHYELGRAWFRKAQFEKAAENLREALAANPMYAPAFVLLGQSYMKLGKVSQAQAAFKKGRSLDNEQLEQIHENITSSEHSSGGSTRQE